MAGGKKWGRQSGGLGVWLEETGAEKYMAVLKSAMMFCRALALVAALGLPAAATGAETGAGDNGVM